MNPDVGFITCSVCGLKGNKDHRWGKTKDEGWFFTREGKAFCPEHIPDWVPAWRARQTK